MRKSCPVRPVDWRYSNMLQAKWKSGDLGSASSVLSARSVRILGLVLLLLLPAASGGASTMLRACAPRPIADTRGLPNWNALF